MYDPTNNKLLSIKQNVKTIPDNSTSELTSQILCDYNGKYLYCGNRGHNTIVRYIINENNGLLYNNNINDIEWINCNGIEPRYFNIEPNNNYLFVNNQEGNNPNISIFKIDHHNNGNLLLQNEISVPCSTYIQFF